MVSRDYPAGSRIQSTWPPEPDESKSAGRGTRSSRPAQRVTAHPEQLSKQSGAADSADRKNQAKARADSLRPDLIDPAEEGGDQQAGTDDETADTMSSLQPSPYGSLVTHVVFAEFLFEVGLFSGHGEPLDRKDHGSDQQQCPEATEGQREAEHEHEKPT